MRSSEVARLAGVTVETLRFYERKGLLSQPPRTPSGYRNYTEADLERIRFIRDCQSFGFTLADIKPLMHLHGLAANKPAGEPGPRMMTIVQDRLAQIDSKLQALQRMKEYLSAALRESENRRRPVCLAEKLRNSPEPS